MTKYCNNCEAEAVAGYKTQSETWFLLCETCKEAFGLGQANPEAELTGLDTIAKKENNLPVEYGFRVTGLKPELNDEALRALENIADLMDVQFGGQADDFVIGLPDQKSDWKLEAVVSTLLGLDDSLQIQYMEA